MKKRVLIDDRANKELGKFPEQVQAKFAAYFVILTLEGFLIEPLAKRINKDLFEIRVKHKGQWRATYAYTKGDLIIILTAFAKKTQKLTSKELNKALNRLNDHK